jgi:hypothetical protein
VGEALYFFNFKNINMEIIKLNPNHDADNIHKALNIPENVVKVCREKVFFTAIANALFVDEMYSETKEAPRSLTTVTGDLHKCLQMSDNQLEYEVILLEFLRHHDVALSAYKHYSMLHDNDDPELSRKFKKLQKLMELKDIITSDDEEKDSNEITGNTMLKRVKFVKKSNYNFAKYMDLLNQMIKKEEEKKINIEDEDDEF